MAPPASCPAGQAAAPVNHFTLLVGKHPTWAIAVPSGTTDVASGWPVGVRG